MALIKCPECEHSVSDRAISCPFCGFPLREYLEEQKEAEERENEEKLRQENDAFLENRRAEYSVKKSFYICGTEFSYDQNEKICALIGADFKMSCDSLHKKYMRMCINNDEQPSDFAPPNFPEFGKKLVSMLFEPFINLSLYYCEKYLDEISKNERNFQYEFCNMANANELLKSLCKVHLEAYRQHSLDFDNAWSAYSDVVNAPTGSSQPIDAVSSDTLLGLVGANVTAKIINGIASAYSNAVKKHEGEMAKQALQDTVFTSEFVLNAKVYSFLNNLIDVIADIYKTVLINILLQYKAIYESYTFPFEDFDFQQYLDIMGSENKSESELKTAFLSTLRKNPGDHFVYTTALGFVFFDYDDIKNIIEMLDFFERRNDAIVAIKDAGSSAYKYLELGADIRALWQAEKEKREEEERKREEEDRKRKEAEEKERLQREAEEKQKKEAEEKARREAEEKARREAEQERLAREEEERKKEEERAKVLKYGKTFRERFLNCVKGTPSEEYLINGENEKDELHPDIPEILYSYAGVVVAEEFIVWGVNKWNVNDLNSIIWKESSSSDDEIVDDNIIIDSKNLGRVKARTYGQDKSVVNAINIGLGTLDLHFEDSEIERDRKREMSQARDRAFFFYTNYRDKLDYVFLSTFRKRYKALSLLDWKYGNKGLNSYYPVHSTYPVEKECSILLRDLIKHPLYVLDIDKSFIITESYFIEIKSRTVIPCNIIWEFVTVDNPNVFDVNNASHTIVVTSRGYYVLGVIFTKNYLYKLNKVFENFRPDSYEPHSGKKEGFCFHCGTFVNPAGLLGIKCPNCRNTIFTNNKEGLHSLPSFDGSYPLALKEIEKNKYSADEKQLLELISDKA